jgi:hypothetical protein
MARIRKFKKLPIQYLQCQTPGCENVFPTTNPDAKYCNLCKARMSKQAKGLEA